MLELVLKIRMTLGHPGKGHAVTRHTKLTTGIGLAPRALFVYLEAKLFTDDLIKSTSQGIPPVAAKNIRSMLDDQNGRIWDRRGTDRQPCCSGRSLFAYLDLR